MPKRTASTLKTPDLHQLTVRITPTLETQLEAYALVTGRTYRDLVESAIEKYLGSLKLTDGQRRKVQVLVGK